jgi:hypothetical protein
MALSWINQRLDRIKVIKEFEMKKLAAFATMAFVLSMGAVFAQDPAAAPAEKKDAPKAAKKAHKKSAKKADEKKDAAPEAPKAN